MAGLVVYLFVVGLDKADKVGSSIGGVLALVALGTPYLLPRSREEDPMLEHTQASEIVVEDSGDANATGGGEANTGAQAVEGAMGAVRVTGSGNATADGPGSVANTGAQGIPRS
ncbi:hypothetical protein ACSHWB_35930 [Lentzea sp. HUAS TT2]|uniref:hypothetical protein n=1 Tax=Lentzea sp. HUAS TT2 TaxID=3447454 RepID=UPI003F724C8E